MTPMYTSLIVLAGILAGTFLLVLYRTRNWPLEGKTEALLKGLALPQGSVRGLIAFLVIGAFVIFVFFGKDAVTTVKVLEFDASGNPVSTEEDTTLFTTVLASLSTLTGAVTGFYFAGRTAQSAAETSKLSGSDGT